MELKHLLIVLAAAAGLAALPACDDGPAEEVGESIDDAVDDIGDAVEDAWED